MAQLGPFQTCLVSVIVFPIPAPEQGTLNITHTKGTPSESCNHGRMSRRKGCFVLSNQCYQGAFLLSDRRPKAVPYLQESSAYINQGAVTAASPATCPQCDSKLNGEKA